MNAEKITEHVNGIIIPHYQKMKMKTETCMK